MAKPGQDVELNRLVQDQQPGQVAPGPAPQNLAEHLPNVPSYRPPITRIPVLVTRRTALSNSSFAKETRSSIRRLGSVSSLPSTLQPAEGAWLGLSSCRARARVWAMHSLFLCCSMPSSCFVVAM